MCTMTSEVHRVMYYRIAPVHIVRRLVVMLHSNTTISQHAYVCIRTDIFNFGWSIIWGIEELTVSVQSKHVLVHSRLDYCNSVITCLLWSIAGSTNWILLHEIYLHCYEICLKRAIACHHRRRIGNQIVLGQMHLWVTEVVRHSTPFDRFSKLRKSNMSALSFAFHA